MVEVVDPQKDEKILDPACGTAGFLISAYKHILQANIGENGGSALTSEEQARLAAGLKGYDISPDMVRLSLANMYLHGFTDPHISEYDTLTSEDNWNEFADVILANPPFMSPKGGIRPHNRFSVNSKRSEVLFVDYMAGHLGPAGRAGIIVPEGIIFQSQNAYKQLRKMLVDEYLVAVVSLPAGVFNPYAGVKTSVLILDKPLAKRANHVAFFKVENDGYNLGAQRRSIEGSDLPGVKAEIAEYLRRLRAGESVDDFEPTLGLVVEKEKIAENGEYNLSGERYRESRAHTHEFPLVYIGDKSLFRVESGGTPRSGVEEYWSGGVPWITLVDLPARDFITEIRNTQRTISEQGLNKSSAKLIPQGSVLVSTRATIGRIAINQIPLATNQGFKNVVIEAPNRVLSEYVALALTKLVPLMESWATGGTFKEISKSKFCELQIPLPPLDIQKEIVAEIEGYQKVIDGARAVVDNYRPHIVVDPEWPMVALGEVCEIIMGQSPPGKTYNLNGEGVPLINGPVEFGPEPFSKTIVNQFTTAPTKICLEGDLVLCVRGSTTGRMNIAGYSGCIGRGVAAIRSSVSQPWVNYVINSLQERIYQLGVGSTFPNVTSKDLAALQIPLPPLETQQAIVAEIEAEQALVDANRELMNRFEKKIEVAIARVWGEDA